MPRKHLIRSSDFPYHVTNRSNNRDFFYLPYEDLWKIFLEVFSELEDQFTCQTHAFVLMSNHYHLLISTPEANLGEAMKYLHREVARRANKNAGRINHFFGGRYKWSLIIYENYYWNALKYIFRNPIRAGVCKSVKDYKYSSLNSSEPHFKWQLNDFFLDRNKQIHLDIDWLDQEFNSGKEVLIQKALRRREFTLPPAKGRKRSLLEEARYKI